MLVMQAVKASELFLGTKYAESTGDSVYQKLAKEKENIVLTGIISVLGYLALLFVFGILEINLIKEYILKSFKAKTKKLSKETK